MAGKLVVAYSIDPMALLVNVRPGQTTMGF
jgi:hypothetical protein